MVRCISYVLCMAVLSCCIRSASGWANAVVFFVGGWRLLEAFIVWMGDGSYLKASLPKVSLPF
jgi:hypothetical protein